MKSGIYKIINKDTQRIYIGSAVNLNNRKREHFYHLRKQSHQNTHLQRLWNKYGEESLSFEIVEYCDIEVLLEREQFYINTLNPDINICKIAGSTLGRKHSEACKDKMSLQRKGKSHHSSLQRDRIREVNLQRSSSIKMLEARSRAVLQLDMQGNFLQEYINISTAIRLTKINNIPAVLRGTQVSSGGFKWEYKEITTADIQSRVIKTLTKKQNIQQSRIKAAKKMQKSVLQLNNLGECIQVFQSIKEAEIAMSGKVGPNISNCIRGRQKTAYSYMWREN